MYVIKYIDLPIDNSRLFESQSGTAIWVKKDGSVVNMDDVVIVVDAVIQDLGQRFPSIEQIIKHKDIIYTDNPYIRTMATDGVSIFINKLKFQLHLL